jgi:hypothetical protein
MSEKQEREAVTVTFAPAMRRQLEAAARREDRSLSAQIRHLVACALAGRAVGAGQEAA